MSLSRNARIEHGSMLLAAIACLCAQVALGLRLQAIDVAPAPGPAPLEAKFAWSPDLFRTVTFGHWTAGLDWLWIQILADPDLSHVPKGVHPKSYYDLMLMTDLDPAFFDLYYGGAHLLAVIRDDGPGAKDLLVKAERFFHEDLVSYPASFRDKYWRHPWQIPLVFGYVELFELDNIDAAAARFSEASAMPGAPAYLASLSEHLRTLEGRYEVGIRLLNFLLSEPSSDIVKARLRERQEALSISYFMFKLNRDFEEYARHRRGRPLAELWAGFRQGMALPGADPWGGDLTIGPEGRVVTTTPHHKVFGLE